jgi:hypothetical protein
MKKIFAINGGAGRVISSLPAFERYYEEHGDNFNILCEGGMDMFLGHPQLQDLAIDPNSKDVFKNYIKDNQIVDLEPYRLHDYYNQKVSLSQAFDILINGDTKENAEDLKPKLYLSKEEEIVGAKIVGDAFNRFGKKKTIVIQPYGRSSGFDEAIQETVDVTTRSITQNTFYNMVKNLSKDYNIIYMGENPVPGDIECLHPQANIRQLAAAISQAQYFIGCDSVGQHLAFAFDKPGTVVIGSTYAVNTTYPDYFNIFEKKNAKKAYSPIRVVGFDSHLADRINDSLMDFSPEEEKELIKSIRDHIEQNT